MLVHFVMPEYCCCCHVNKFFEEEQVQSVFISRKVWYPQNCKYAKLLLRYIYIYIYIYIAIRLWSVVTPQYKDENSLVPPLIRSCLHWIVLLLQEHTFKLMTAPGDYNGLLIKLCLMIIIGIAISFCILRMWSWSHRKYQSLSQTHFMIMVNS